MNFVLGKRSGLQGRGCAVASKVFPKDLLEPGAALALGSGLSVLTPSPAFAAQGRSETREEERSSHHSQISTPKGQWPCDHGLRYFKKGGRVNL